MTAMTATPLDTLKEAARIARDVRKACDRIEAHIESGAMSEHLYEQAVLAARSIDRVFGWDSIPAAPSSVALERLMVAARIAITDPEAY